MADNPFDDALDDVVPKFEGGDEAGTRAGKQKRWEHNRVKYLLEYYGLTRQSREICDLSKKGTGLNQLTFAGFKLLNPTFPIWLEFRKIPNLHLGKLVEAFCLPSHAVKPVPGVPPAKNPKRARGRSKSWIYQAFEDAEADAPERYWTARANFGLVFEFVYAEVGPSLIAYRYNGSLLPAKSGTVHLRYEVPDGEQEVCVSGFDVFLDKIRWSPAE